MSAHSNVTRLADDSLRFTGGTAPTTHPVSANVKLVAGMELVTVRTGGRVIATETTAVGLGAPLAICKFGATRINGRSIF